MLAGHAKVVLAKQYRQAVQTKNVETGIGVGMGLEVSLGLMGDSY